MFRPQRRRVSRLEVTDCDLKFGADFANRRLPLAERPLADPNEGLSALLPAADRLSVDIGSALPAPARVTEDYLYFVCNSTILEYAVHAG